MPTSSDRIVALPPVVTLTSPVPVPPQITARMPSPPTCELAPMVPLPLTVTGPLRAAASMPSLLDSRSEPTPVFTVTLPLPQAVAWMASPKVPPVTTVPLPLTVTVLAPFWVVELMASR